MSMHLPHTPAPPGAQVAQSNSLTDLAARIKAEHEACGTALERGAKHAMAAGDLLIGAKALLKHGQWLPWLAEHCAMSERTAQLYMRLARARPEVEANPQRVADLTVRGAMSALMPPNEGEAILRRIAEADAQIAEASEEIMERQRGFAVWLYEQSPSERDAFLATITPQERGLISRWRKIDLAVVSEAKWRISEITS